uniref:Uncharacterized protein n=1 Tax=Gasterosteus aculeatus TaxID=69293 RepID=G3NJR7_GASAC
MYSCTVSIPCRLAIRVSFLHVLFAMLTLTASMRMKRYYPWCKGFIFFHGIKYTVRMFPVLCLIMFLIVFTVYIYSLMIFYTITFFY